MIIEASASVYDAVFICHSARRRETPRWVCFVAWDHGFGDLFGAGMLCGSHGDERTAVVTVNVEQDGHHSEVYFSRCCGDKYSCTTVSALCEILNKHNQTSVLSSTVSTNTIKQVVCCLKYSVNKHNKTICVVLSTVSAMNVLVSRADRT